MPTRPAGLPACFIHRLYFVNGSEAPQAGLLKPGPREVDARVSARYGVAGHVRCAMVFHE